MKMYSYTNKFRNPTERLRVRQVKSYNVGSKETSGCAMNKNELNQRQQPRLTRRVHPSGMMNKCKKATGIKKLI